MKLFERENQLDEMQEKQMRLIEKRSFWGVWIALFAAIMIQQALGADFKQYSAEWVIFMLASLYSVIESVRKGLWDRHFVPTPAANAVLSLGGGAFVAAYSGILMWRSMGFEAGDPIWPFALCALLAGAMTALLIFGLMQLMLVMYKKRRKALENEEENNENK